MNRLRTEVDDRFDVWYMEVKRLLNSLGLKKKMCRAKASIYRTTHPAKDPKEQFKRAIAIPFIHDVNNQLAERFPKSSVTAVSAFMSLILSVIGRMGLKKVPSIIDQLSGEEPDIPRLGSLQAARDLAREVEGL